MAKASTKKGGRVRISLVGPDSGPEAVALRPRLAILANLTGKEEADLEAFEDPDFVKDLTRDNFDRVLAEIEPEMETDVDNVLSGKPAGKLKVRLSFTAFDQFGPAAVARNVPELAAQLSKRDRLNEWRAKLANKPKLAAALKRCLMNRNRQAPSGAGKTRKES